MRAPFRVFIVMFALGLSQAWAFEGFHELWGRKEAASQPTNPEVENLKSERATHLNELKKIEPIHNFIFDEVKSLLPNLIGAIEGKGSRLEEEDIASLCGEIKRQLLVPSACSTYIKSYANRDKEDITNVMNDRKAEFGHIQSRYRTVKRLLADIEARLQRAETAK